MRTINKFQCQTFKRRNQKIRLLKNENPVELCVLCGETLKTNRTYDTGISITASAGASGKQ